MSVVLILKLKYSLGGKEPCQIQVHKGKGSPPCWFRFLYRSSSSFPQQVTFSQEVAIRRLLVADSRKASHSGLQK